MFGRKNKRAAAPKGRGAAAAKQMGLFLDLNPDKMMAMDQDVDDPALEAEFAAIVGKKPSVVPREKKPAKAPLPMEDIAKMAEACMKDSDDDDDDDDTLEDEDLLAELQEMVQQEETEDSGAASPTSPISASSSSSEAVQQGTLVLSVPGSVQHTLEERLDMYKIAVSNAKAAGESSKARRYERGLKTLQTMLASVRKGGKIDEAEIPPPVVCGGASSAASPNEHRESDSAVEVSPGSVNGSPVVTDTEANGYRAELWNVTNSASVLSAEEQQAGSGAESLIVGQPTRDVLLERQRGYRMAALKAKQAGDVEQAKRYLKASKEIDTAIESLDKDQPADPSSILPSPSQAMSVNQNVPQATQQVSSSAAKGQGCDSTQAQPSTRLEALEQRLTKYKEAFSQAKASEDERKARMYDRIAKQYQSAIRAEKAGRTVNYGELPAPPGFPPIPGQKVSSGEQGLAAVLETANKLASIDAEVDADDDEEGEAKSAKMDGPRKPTLAVQPIVQDPTTAPSSSSGRSSKRGSVADTAEQQLEFLEGRKKQYLKAALQAKQKKDLEQAKAFLRSAKALDPMIEAVSSGKKVDISKEVPSPPGDEDEDFILVHHSDVQASEKDENVYTQLKKLLEEQYKKCQTYCKQFTHLGNMAETTKFENMAKESKKSLEILALAQTRGLQPPKHHFEERKYRTVRIFPELSSTDMVVVIVRGMNLPAPHGVATNDLDTYVKFDFPYPSTDHPQKHKTSVAKNTNNPEYNQNFNLNINRSHRGFRRVIQSKGLKLEVLHKGGFLRSDKPVGTAQIKLNKLEAESEVREIVEVMDGRKATGGRLEVRVRLREPLSGQDLQIVTERWLVLEEPQVLL